MCYTMMTDEKGDWLAVGISKGNGVIYNLKERQVAYKFEQVAGCTL